jgi:hypothetical protein
MNRIPVRGAGFAAAAVAAASLAWSAPSTGGGHASVEHVQSTLSAAVLVTAYDARRDGSAAELALLHASRLSTVHAPALARAHRLHQLALAQQATKHAHALAQRAAQRASRAAVRPVAPGTVRALGQHMAAARGWTGEQFACLDAIWTHESNWRVDAANASSGTYGIPQAQPGSKMASAGADWRTNPATQIAWGLAYIARTYGDPCSAWAFWQTHYWY